MPELTRNRPTLQDAAPVLRTTACGECGGPVEPVDRFCPACGAEQAAEVVAAVAAQRYFQCKNCGAEVGVDPEQRSYTCPFCDSNYVVEFSPDLTNRQAPEFVIPFAITPEQAQERFHRWLGQNSWFRPGDLRSAQIAEKLKGVYLPFWSFAMLARSAWSARIGEHWYRTETYTTIENGKTVTKTRTVTETEWWNLDGNHHRYYSGYLVSGSRGLKQSDAERIKPFHLAALKRYQPQFLAGWLSEEYSVDREEALRRCQEEFCRREQQNVAEHLPGDTYSGLNVRTQFSDVSSDLALLPIYLLSYKYQGRLYRFLLNGQTGKAAGDKPLSALRILVAVAAVVVLLLAIGLGIMALGAL